MSKHFELMQQMEAERLLGSEPTPSTPAQRPVRAATQSFASAQAVADLPAMSVARAKTALPVQEWIQDSVQVPAQIPVQVAPAMPRRPAAIPSLPVGERRWASAEALRLVQQIFLRTAQAPPAAVVFAGLDHGNGCSEVCASVAEALAGAEDRPVCLIEANFRSPGLSALFGTTNDFGLTEALVMPGPIRSFARQVAQENFWLLSSGTLEVNSPSLLTSQSLRDRLIELRREFAFLVIDAPALNRSSDAVLLGQLSDGLVMVLGADSSQREAASDAAANLRSSRVPILAAVLNKGASPTSLGSN